MVKLGKFHRRLRQTSAKEVPKDMAARYATPIAEVN